MGSSTLEIYGGSLNIAQTTPTSIAFLSTLFHRYSDTHNVNHTICQLTHRPGGFLRRLRSRDRPWTGNTFSISRPVVTLAITFDPTVDARYIPHTPPKTDYPAGSPVGISHITQTFTYSSRRTMTYEIIAKRAQSIAVPTTFVAPKPPIRSSSLSSPTIESESSHGSQSTPRRISRKLPPALTESLLALERFQSTTSDDHGSSHEKGSMQYSTYRRDSSGGSSVQSSQTLTPPWNPPTEFVKYTLVVEPPTDDNCRVYEPGPKAIKRMVAPHQSKVEPRMVDTRRPLSLTFDSISVDDLSRPLSPGYSRNGPVSNSSLFKSNWPSRRPQTPTAVPELAPELAPPSLVSDSTASSSGWSALRELEERERENRLKPKVKETRKERKSRQKLEKENFDPDTPPGLRDLFNASLCEVLDEHGNKTQFGDLVTGKRTIVVFIRHCTFTYHSFVQY
jgi:hypothetical protein